MTTLSNDFSDFIVPKDIFDFPDGEYVAQSTKMETKDGAYGKYYLLTWNFLRPLEFEKRIHVERFSIQHPTKEIRKIAINNFTNLCRDIGELNEGDIPKEENFLFKVANILIRNKISKDGRKFANIVRRTLVSPSLKEGLPPIPEEGIDNPSKYGVISSPTEFQTSNIILDDDVPF